MARTKKSTGKVQKKAKIRALPAHAFWSGALSFGLVNVPVLVFPATRHSGVRLRMINENGAPLERRFYAARDDRELTADKIARGYELDDGSFIIVGDKELQDLEPQKTREIDLREFVNLRAITPAFVERGYYLTPFKDSTKAYRLLAEVMEKTGRAGIATFVMRDREYLVAIFAQGGILCALTLRFQDEVRDPRSIGLPEPEIAPRPRVLAFERAIDALSARTLSAELLADVDTQKLEALIAKKKRAGKDLIRMTHDSAQRNDEPDDDEPDVDLLTTIRQSLRQAKKTRKRPKT